MADYLTFQNIYEAIERIIKATKGSKKTMIKELANMTYFEMLSCDELYPMYWLRDFDDRMASVAPATISGLAVGATSADPLDLTTEDAHGLAVGAIVSIYDVVGMTEVNNRAWRVSAVGSTVTCQLKDLDNVVIDSTGYTAYTSGGSLVHRGLVLPNIDVERILSVNWDGYVDPLTKIDENELEKQTNWWGSNYSKPTRYMHRKKFDGAGAEVNIMLWFPGADAAYDMRFWAELRVSPMSADADAPRLPHRFHNGIIAGTAIKLIQYDMQIENPSVWAGIYQFHISQLKEFNRKFYERDKFVKPFMV